MDQKRILIKSSQGDLFEVEISDDTPLHKLAADFFETQEWPTADSKSRRLRAVVELLDPDNPDRTKRLDGSQTVSEAGLSDGDLITIFPESIAGCFVEYVKISLANGQKKQIQEVQIGDTLLSFDPHENNFTTANVVKIFRNQSDSYLAINDKLHITETHPVWANNEWVKAGDLKLGNFLQDQFGNKVKINSIKKISKTVEIYNLYVSSIEHTFFAEEFLVHNMNLKEAINEVFEQSIKEKISQDEYNSLKNLIDELQIEIVNQQDKILSLEEQIDSMELKFSEASKLFNDLSDVFKTKHQTIFLKKNALSPRISFHPTNNNGTQKSEDRKALVRIQIDQHLDKFDEKKKENLISSIAKQSSISEDDIDLIYVFSGSVVVTLEMPEEAALKFMSLYVNQSPIINELKIERVEVKSLLPPPSNEAYRIAYLPDQTDKKKTKILFLAANPLDTTRLSIDHEIKSILKNIRSSKERGYLELDQEWAVTTDTLMQAVLDKSPNIIHFSGHGQHEGILLQTESGESKIISADALEKLFEIFKDTVRCVIINSCYSENQAKAIKNHIPYVIGMKTGIPDKAAIAFSIGFYKAIGAGKDIVFAFNYGVTAIQLEGVGGEDIPVLFNS